MYQITGQSSKTVTVKKYRFLPQRFNSTRTLHGIRAAISKKSRSLVYPNHDVLPFYTKVSSLKKHLWSRDTFLRQLMFQTAEKLLAGKRLALILGDGLDISEAATLTLENKAFFGILNLRPNISKTTGPIVLRLFSESNRYILILPAKSGNSVGTF